MFQKESCKQAVEPLLERLLSAKYSEDLIPKRKEEVRGGKSWEMLNILSLGSEVIQEIRETPGDAML